MHLPRLSIADVMALTALVALDCLAWRDGANPGVAILRLVLLPSLNVVVIATYILARGVRRRALSHFLAGFVIAGWLLELLFVYSNGELIADALAPRPAPDPGVIEFVMFDSSQWIIAATDLLQLFPACLVGLIYLFFRARRERRRPTAANDPE